jgi:hypothetical protein
MQYCSTPEETRSFWLRLVRDTVSALCLRILSSLMRTPSAPSGTDATEAFEDVGHSDEARALLPGMYLGDYDKSSGVRIQLTHPSTTTPNSRHFPGFCSRIQDIKLYDDQKTQSKTSVNIAVEQGSKYVLTPSLIHSAD